MTEKSLHDRVPVTLATASRVIEREILPVLQADGSRFELIFVHPAEATRRCLYWVAAMGVPARHYLPLAEALAALGVAVILHEWRGIGSSNRRASRRCNWGYRELLQDDLRAGLASAGQHWPHAQIRVGGHSLGGQLGALAAALNPRGVFGLVLVASGAPYWRMFRHAWLLRASFVLAPLVAAIAGYLPGRRIGFGGNEARGVIEDWARTGRTGRYAVAAMGEDLERQLAELRVPVLALRLRDDWLGPDASLNWLLEKMPLTRQSVEVLGPEQLDGQAAGHFAWMKTPAPIASHIAHWLQQQDPEFAPDGERLA